MKRSVAVAACLLLPALAIAAETTVTVNGADSRGVGPSVGTVRMLETPYGLAFYPDLKGLPPGLHGFHVHQNPSCAPAEKTARRSRRWLPVGISIRKGAKTRRTVG